MHLCDGVSCWPAVTRLVRVMHSQQRRLHITPQHLSFCTACISQKHMVHLLATTACSTSPSSPPARHHAMLCCHPLCVMCVCVHVCHQKQQEQYINDKEFLLASAESVGLPRDGAAAVLDNPAGKGEQLVQQELGKYPGVTGVPHFVINGR